MPTSAVPTPAGPTGPDVTAAHGTALILAAGQGTRMRSPQLPKVLHTLLDWPMVFYPVDAALRAGVQRVVTVVSPGHDGQGGAVRQAVAARFPEARFAVQHEPRGTGHAVASGLAALPEPAPGLGATAEAPHTVLVLSGDVPGLRAETLRALLGAHAQGGHLATFATFEVDDPTGYGRVVREGGRPLGIIEHADATPAQRAIREVNAGLYAFDLAALGRALAALDKTDADDNAQGEVYLTDVIGILAQEGADATDAHAQAAGETAARVPVATFALGDPAELAGVNTRAQLAQREATLQARRNHALMEAGVTMRQPDTVRVSADAQVHLEPGEPGVTLGPGVELRGHTTVAAGTLVDTGCVLTDCVVGRDVHVKPYVVAEGAVLGDGAAVGPFAHLRPGTRLGARAKVGNFVETKKAVIGDGSKASHLTYLGDCEVGRDVNVGAGTITCNYDGVAKHKTVLGDGVFVGSDTQLVAPVKVGANVTIAAGTTVTADVPEGALVLSRVPQQVREGYFERHRRPREEAARAEKEAKRAAAQAARKAGK